MIQRKKPSSGFPTTVFPTTGFPTTGKPMTEKPPTGFPTTVQILFKCLLLGLLSVCNFNHEVSEEGVRYGLKFNLLHFDGRVFDIILNIVLNVNC